MISKLFINACIVFTFTFIGFFPFRNRQIRRRPPVTVRVGAGIAAGLMGVILMVYSLPIPDSKLIIDLRHLPVIICAVFLGPWASISAGIIECIGRIAIFGTSKTSVLAGGNMLAISIVAPFVARLGKRLTRRMTIVNVYALLQISALIYLLAPDKSSLRLMFIVYWGVSIISGYASAWLIVQLVNHFDRQHQLETLSSVDFLTGLNNTRKFDSVFNELTAKAVESREPFSLLAIDIDHFKRVNDIYGHSAGDAVLRQLAEIFTHTRRSVDTVSRNGGEEFTILLPSCTKEEAVNLAQRIRKAVEEAEFMIPDGSSIHITVSIGVAAYLESTQEVTSMIQLADEGLYFAKRQGRNRVCIAE